jgi:hypothetical protein
MREGNLCFSLDSFYAGNGLQGVLALLNRGDRAHLAFLEAEPAGLADPD